MNTKDEVKAALNVANARLANDVKAFALGENTRPGVIAERKADVDALRAMWLEFDK